MPSRPNILFVFSDQHRADALGCYGNQVIKTPHLDAFAEEGVRAEAALSPTPVCCPYRASLMTGQYAHRLNYLTNYLPFEPSGPCVAEVFRDAGYSTGYIGKWHLHFPRGDMSYNQSESPSRGFVPPGQRHGFADFWAAYNGGHRYHRWEYYRDDDPTPVKVEGYQPEVQVDQALEFIRREEGHQRPWCLFLSWGPPHTPYEPPQGYAEQYQDAPLPGDVPPGRPAEHARRVLPRYYGLIQSLDEAFGRLLRMLDQLGAAQRTIVVYTADHGEMLGSHGYRGNKRWPYDAAIRVPFLIRWPGEIPAGGTVVRPFTTPDIFPTLVDLAGLPVPHGLDGRSARTALLSGDELGRDEWAYCSVPYAYVPWPGWRAIRSTRYMYARTKDRPWLLFDLQEDPLQLHNRIAERVLREKLDGLLTAKMDELGDSWDSSVAAGDWENWLPGSAKMIHNDLDVPWPGGG